MNLSVRIWFQAFTSKWNLCRYIAGETTGGVALRRMRYRMRADPTVGLYKVRESS